MKVSLTFRNEHFREIDDVWMAQVLQKLDLANSRNRETVLLGLHPDPFQRHKFARLDVASLVDLSVRAFSDLNDSLIELGWRYRRGFDSRGNDGRGSRCRSSSWWLGGSGRDGDDRFRTSWKWRRFSDSGRWWM